MSPVAAPAASPARDTKEPTQASKARRVLHAVYHAEPRAGLVALGSPWTVLGSTAGTVATVATFAASHGSSDVLAWGNTALATFQNLELPIGTYAVGAQGRRAAGALPPGPPAPAPARLPGLLTAAPGSDLVAAGLRPVNVALRPVALGLVQVLASAGAATAALGGLAGLWIGYGVNAPPGDYDGLQAAVNAIPQYFTTGWAAETLLLLKARNDEVRRLDAALRAAHLARTGVALPSPLEAPAGRLRAIPRRLANDLRNLTGTPLNALLNVAASVGLGIATGVCGGLSSDLNAQANAALATLQFPDFIAMKLISRETRQILEALARDLGVAVPGHRLPCRAWTCEGARGGVLGAVAGAARGLSRLAGTPEAAVLCLAGLAALGGTYAALDYDTWLAVFNGIPQCITTPLFDAVIYDVNVSAHLQAALLGAAQAPAGA